SIRITRPACVRRVKRTDMEMREPGLPGEGALPLPATGRRANPMPLDPQLLRSQMPITMRHAFTRRDTMLYALGVGVAVGKPLDPAALRFVYEEKLLALPTMAVILGYP